MNLRLRALVLKRPYLFFTLALINTGTFATKYHVNSVTTFSTAHDSAVAGDSIVWTDGTYSDVTFTISKNQIVVIARTPGGVIFNGNSYVTITGSYITFADFQFVNVVTSNSTCIGVKGSHNIISGINMNTLNVFNYLKVFGGAQYNQIINCNFQNKPVESPSNALVVVDESSTTPNYTIIRYCTFQHCPGPGADFGNEPIRLGLRGTHPSRCLIEYCYFTDLGGADNETISVKSLENVMRYNTYDNNPTGEISLRHGGANQIYGNFFINDSRGVVVKEGVGNLIYNNYFATSANHAPVVMAVGKPLYSVLPSNTSIIHNTFYNCKALNVTNTTPTDTKFYNNIFYNTPVNGANANVSYTGNIILGSFGITVPSGNITADPLPLLNSNGYYSIKAGSPAINAANGTYADIPDIIGIDEDHSILTDISGKARPSSKTEKDLGCSEFNASGTVINKPLTLNDAGPFYLRKSR